ncbi:hypothetical protein LLEC1_03022 [Akanthomyces lecanii]|uniref:Uncharacterized protein n=1 Tax=Cordyceps confragosa TaxID=2714763 RepID=A0A179I6I0_CORDF|nr:hypothetical protein LLEC1_03022 [Akanthomyces lecanii]
MLFYLITTLFLGVSLCAASTLGTPANCDESTQRVCYANASQGLRPEDIKYVAEYLRYLGDAGAAKFLTMPQAADCAEWTLPVPSHGGTVLALAKHISPRITSSVLYEDLAVAVAAPDGGSPREDLLGCGKDGGQMEVKANLKNPLYGSDGYKKSGARPEGILIKLVKAPPPTV